MSVTFVVVTVVLNDRALITDGPAVSPHTLEHLPGPALRGMVAAACTDAERELLIAGEAVLFAPALPLMRIPRTSSDPQDTVATVAYPAPRTTVGIADEYGVVELDDARTLSTNSEMRTFPVTGAMVCSPAADVDARPAAVPTSTHRRLSGSQRPDTVTGMYTQTVLEPGTWFRTRLRLADHIDDPEPVVDTLRAVLARAKPPAAGQPSLLRIGSGASSAYGGDVHIQSVTTVTDRPWDRPSPSTAANQSVHLVTVTPALVRDRRTGEHDPAALGEHVTDMLTEVISAALGTPVRVRIAAPAPSIGSVLAGGFHRGYRGLRPEHWAAAAGSVVTVTTDVPIPGTVWDRALCRRIGDRTVDGFGVVRIDSAPSHWNEESAPRYRGDHDEHRVVRLADGTLAPDVDYADPEVRRFQDRLFREGSDGALGDLAVLLARRAERIPSNSTLARLATVLPSTSWDIKAARSDLAAAHALLGSLTSDEVPDKTRPAAAALRACILEWDEATRWTLFDVLDQLTAPGYDPVTSILRRTADQVGNDAAALALPAALVEHSLAHGDQAHQDVVTWIDEHQVPLRHALAVTLLHALRTGKEHR